MIKKELEFTFKGERQYVQGADIYNAMINQFRGKEITNIYFSIHDFIRSKDCLLYISDDPANVGTDRNYPARCRVRVDGGEKYLFLEEDIKDKGPVERYDYDESVIHRACRLEKSSIYLVSRSPYTFAETIVSMNKKLLCQRYPDAAGFWAFVRLELRFQCEERDSLRLVFLHNLHFRLTKTGLYYRDDEIGNIYFSLAKT